MNIFSLSNQPNAIAVTLALIKALKINVSLSSISHLLEDHPEFPSLLAISDCLTEWHIQNQAYQINREEYHHTELLYPFIAHYKINGGTFSLIHEIKDGTVIYTDEKKHRFKISEEEFLKRWDGIALHATASEESGETNYRNNVFKAFLRSLLAPTALIVFCYLLYLILGNQAILVPIMSSGLLKLFGIAVSVLLLMQGLNANNPFIKNLCGYCW